MTWLYLIISLVGLLHLNGVASEGAFVQVEDNNVTLGNDFFTITFWGNATAKSLIVNDVDIIADVDKNLQTWYLDWNGERAYFTPYTVDIVRDSVEEAHVAYIQNASEGLLYIEFHLVVLKDVSGLYQYVKVSNPNEETIELAEFRTVHRFSHSIMPKVSNIIHYGDIVPNVWDRPLIQDTTWQLADGTYWSKYDLCGYLRETPWLGVYGGGFGAWIVSASREYHSGGPLKQELLVHHDSLMLNYFHSSHFGTPNQFAPPGWSKFYGPVLIYLNTGTDEEILEDVANRAEIEQAKWPYSWVDEEEYPLARGSISGTVTGQTRAMVVVYDSLEEEFDLQTLGYLYHTETDQDGGFTIQNIRPGDYQVVAYPLAGQGSDNVARQNVTIDANASIDVGSLDLPEPEDIIWSLGEVDRRSSEYHFSDEARNFYWHLLPPANLTFEIGKSNLAKDWYYAQTRIPGAWKIIFEDIPDLNARVLRVAFAAATSSASVTISVNNVEVGQFAYENDKTIYRDALQSGNYHPEKMDVAADLIVDGRNVVTFTLNSGMVMYDAISFGRA